MKPVMSSVCVLRSVFAFCVLRHVTVADPGFSKWGGAVLSQMGGVHILFSDKKCMKLKEIGLKWGGRTSFSALL